MAQPAKKAVKKTAKKTAAQLSDEQNWAIWEARIVSVAVSMVCVAGIANELFIEKEPREIALLFLGTVLGLPAVVSGAKKLGG